jgi:hypothetical protein
MGRGVSAKIPEMHCQNGVSHCWPNWSMHDTRDGKEHWTQLRDQGAVEKDPERLMVLAKEIIRMLTKKNNARKTGILKLQL